ALAALLAKQVAEVEAEPAAGAPRRTGSCRTTTERAAGPEQRALLVVLLAALVVGEHVVRLGDLLEARLGLGLSLVRVGVELARELAVGLLDLVGRGVLGDAERLVEVLLQEVPGAHRVPSS